jgi:phosphate transport system substrate-binding protein
MENMITVITIVVVAVIIILLLIKLKTARQRVAVLIGFAVTVLSLLVLLMTIFSLQRTILQILLLVFYASIITFLVLWNKIKNKKVYLLLCVPAVCIVSGIAIMEYKNHIRNIPTVDDDDNFLYGYKPFRGNDFPAKLDEESHLKIIYKLPVLDGATALLPVYASFAQAVYPQGEYIDMNNFVLCSKTRTAYENLLEGKADIIFCAGPSDSQMKQFIDNGLKIKLVPIGMEAFVFFFYKENTVKNISVENILGIY